MAGVLPLRFAVVALDAGFNITALADIDNDPSKRAQVLQMMAEGVSLRHAPHTPSQRAAAENRHKTNYATAEERQQVIEGAIANYNLGLMVFTGLLFIATTGLGIMNFIIPACPRRIYFQPPSKAHCSRNLASFVGAPKCSTEIRYC